MRYAVNGHTAAELIVEGMSNDFYGYNRTLVI